MLESFHLQRSQSAVNALWHEKNALTQKFLGRRPTRLLQPEVVGDRSRLDLLWNGRELGVYAAGKTFLRVDFPDTVSAVIAGMLQEFLDSKCPLPVASLRFRSGLDGLKGFWIDTSNENIKKLLEESAWLQTFLEKGWVIEIGQKHKQVVRSPGHERGLALAPAPALCWLPSFSADNEEIPLKSHVSLFSQPGPEVNRAMIAAGFELLDHEKISNVAWAEWGAGYGNLSAAFASRLGTHAWVSEIEEAASKLLERNAEDFFSGVTAVKASVEEGIELGGLEPRLWIIDPPRSGFGALLRNLKDRPQKPDWALAYHCHLEGLTKDCAILKESGYTLLAWSSVDAFPATTHHEVITLWGNE